MTAIPVDSNLDMQKLQLLNAAIHSLGSAPGSPVESQIYYDSTGGVKTIKFWNGTAWIPVDATKLSAGTLPLSVLVTDPLARANHTGTQLASTISNFDTQVRTSRLDQMAAPTATVSMNSQILSNVATAVSGGDAVNLTQLTSAVSNAAAGIDSKPSVRLLASSNSGLTGLAAIDGITPIAGDRVLCVGQTTGSQNGVYVTAAGAWSRATDADATGEITPGATWFVEEGTTYGASTWRCANTGTITLGSTSISITQLAAATTYTAGNGLGLAGAVFSVTAVANGGITVGGSGIQVDRSKVPYLYTGTAGTGSAGPYTVNHALGTEFVTVQVRHEASPKRLHQVSWSVTDANNISLEPDVTWASGAMRVVVHTAA